MDQIPQALTRAIGKEKVQLGAVVTSITDTQDGAKVAYTDAHGRARAITADYCIAACLHIYLRRSAQPRPGRRGGAGQVQRTAVGKIGLEYKSRWWETDHRIYGGITETDMDVSHIWYPSYGYHGDRGLVVGYYNTGANARTYGALSPVDRAARAVAQGVKIHGEKYRSELAIRSRWPGTSPVLEALDESALRHAGLRPACNSRPDTSTSPATGSATWSPGSTARSGRPATR